MAKKSARASLKRGSDSTSGVNDNSVDGGRVQPSGGMVAAQSASDSSVFCCMCSRCCVLVVVVFLFLFLFLFFIFYFYFIFIFCYCKNKKKKIFDVNLRGSFSARCFHPPFSFVCKFKTTHN
jgi:hypothetical protein